MVRESVQDRKARIAKMQAQQKAAERRRLMLVVGACGAVLALIIGSVGWVIYGEKRKTDEAIALIDVPAASAKCDAATNDPAEGNQNHVGPGTDKPDMLRVEYKTIPPSSGQHFVSPALGERRVYTVADAPALESLVHNLEHGYTVLWYDPSVQASMGKSFEILAERIGELKEVNKKFIVAPWDAARGKFPDGKKYALAHWSADPANPADTAKQAGHRQLCGGLSLEAVESFVKAYPYTASPEPFGA